MRDYRDAQAMAQTLRQEARARNLTLTNSESLEIVARQFGFDNWSILAASTAAAAAEAASDAAFERAIPMLRIFDQAKMAEFYLDWLGFTIDWDSPAFEGAPAYLQVSRGALVLHLTEHHGDCAPGANAFVWTTGIEALRGELIAKRYRFNAPACENAPWGKTLKVNDPFANRLTFCERPGAAGARPAATS